MTTCSYAIVILTQDLCGGLVDVKVINDLVDTVKSISNKSFSVFIATTKTHQHFFESINQKIALYKEHPVEVLFNQEVLSNEYIFVLSGNQQINDFWFNDILEASKHNIVAAVQSQLNFVFTQGDIKSYYPFPTWRNIGSANPYLEHGGFVIKSEVIRKFKDTDLGKVPNWIFLSRLILTSGFAIFNSFQIRTVESKPSFSIAQALLNIYRIAISIIPIKVAPIKSPKKDYVLFNIQKIDCGRSVMARLVCNNYPFIVILMISFVSSLISVFISIKSQFYQSRVAQSLSDYHDKSIIFDATEYKFNPLYWILFEDDRVRIGLWTGADNIIARTSAGIFLKYIFCGVSSFDQIVSNIASEYKQPIQLVAGDLHQYFTSLIQSKVFIIK